MYKPQFIKKDTEKGIRALVRVGRMTGAFRIKAFSCKVGYHVANTSCRADTFLRELDGAEGEVVIVLCYMNAKKDRSITINL